MWKNFCRCHKSLFLMQTGCCPLSVGFFSDENWYVAGQPVCISFLRHWLFLEELGLSTDWLIPRKNRNTKKGSQLFILGSNFEDFFVAFGKKSTLQFFLKQIRFNNTKRILSVKISAKRKVTKTLSKFFAIEELPSTQKTFFCQMSTLLPGGRFPVPNWANCASVFGSLNLSANFFASSLTHCRRQRL